MFAKNLKYYRSRKFMSQRQLANLCNLTPMAICHYESGDRMPQDIEIIEKIAEILEVKVSDFLVPRNNDLNIIHGEFRKKDILDKEKSNQIKFIIEEYFDRFYEVTSLFGGEVLPKPIECETLIMSDNYEEDALQLRNHLNLSIEGPIYNLIGTLENKGILICLVDIGDFGFSGINGFVNNRPYIAINKTMSEERKRSTIVHELVHLMFKKPSCKLNEYEKKVEKIMGAFLISNIDLIREIGIKRGSITKDMCITCKEYGISMSLLVMRAYQCKVISNKIKSEYYENPKYTNIKYIDLEKSTLLEQFVCRAVNENEISVQKGAELLRISFKEMEELC